MAMEHQISGQLHWDTTRAATPGWLLFLEERPGGTPTMLSAFDTHLPRDVSHTEVARLISEMLQRETGDLSLQGQLTEVKDGPVYHFVATYEGPACPP
jgi:hypothetical protein